MTRLVADRVMPFAADDLFALVSDIRSYPTFLPFLKALRVSQEQTSPTGFTCLAEVVVGYKILREKFTTRVIADTTKRHISTRLHSGPLRHLRADWHFEPIAETSDSGAVRTRVSFDIDFDFKVPMLAQLMAGQFDRASQELMAAFEREAARRFA